MLDSPKQLAIPDIDCGEHNRVAVRNDWPTHATGPSLDGRTESMEWRFCLCAKDGGRGLQALVVVLTVVY